MFCFFLFLFLLMLPLAIGHVLQSRGVEGTGTVRPLPGAQEAGSVSAQESWLCTGWGNRLLMSGTTSPLWSFSCPAHLCPWPHASFPESLRMTRITPITAAREAGLRPSTPGSESCSCARNRGGQKTRGGRDPLLATNLENPYLGHFCWLEWQLMKVKCQQNKKVILNYWELIFSHGYMRNRLYYLCTS